MQFNNSTPVGAKALKKFSAFFVYILSPIILISTYWRYGKCLYLCNSCTGWFIPKFVISGVYLPNSHLIIFLETYKLAEGAY